MTSWLKISRLVPCHRYRSICHCTRSLCLARSRISECLCDRRPLQSSNQVDLPIGLVETAVLALTGPNAAAPNPSVFSFCLERVKSLLDDSKAQTLILNVLEASAVAGGGQLQTFGHQLTRRIALQGEDGAFRVRQSKNSARSHHRQGTRFGGQLGCLASR